MLKKIKKKINISSFGMLYYSGIVGPVAARRSRPPWDDDRATSRREAKERSDAAIVTVAPRGD